MENGRERKLEEIKEKRRKRRRERKREKSIQTERKRRCCRTAHRREWRLPEKMKEGEEEVKP